MFFSNSILLYIDLYYVLKLKAIILKIILKTRDNFEARYKKRFIKKNKYLISI